AFRPAAVLPLRSAWVLGRRSLHPFPTRRSSDLADSFFSVKQMLRPSRAHQKSYCRLSLTMADAQILGSHEEDRVSSSPFRLRKEDRKSTRLNSSHVKSSYAVFCLNKNISRHRIE